MTGGTSPGGPASPPTPDGGACLHASCVALGARGLLITGASGTGKSALALTLMAFGARLVADDRTSVEMRDGLLYASCPPAIRGLIEARGIGILTADTHPEVEVTALVDLDRVETDRLPPQRRVRILDREIPLILTGEGLHFAVGLIQYLKGERSS